MKHLTRNVCDGCAVWCQFEPDDWEQTARENPAYEIGHESTHLPTEAECRDCLKAAESFGESCFERLATLAIEAGGELTPWE